MIYKAFITVVALYLAYLVIGLVFVIHYQFLDNLFKTKCQEICQTENATAKVTVNMSLQAECTCLKVVR